MECSPPNRKNPVPTECMDTPPRFVHIDKVEPDAEWHNLHRVHRHHELIVILSGVMHITGRDQTFELRPGDAALYPAGVLHQERSDRDRPVESCFIVFEKSDLNADRIVIRRGRGAWLRPLAATLYEQFLNCGVPPFADKYLALMLEIFSAAGAEAPDPGSDFVRKVQSFMRRRLADRLSLYDLAAVAGKSKFHFLRQYRTETGTTPLKALWDMRCAEAAAFLKYTGLPVKEIAARTGFSDVAHFSRRIKAWSGRSPGELRNNGE